jgi:hypothetical protein
MSAGVTDYGANAFADHFSGQATLPTTLYVALCSSEPDQATDGTTLDALEPAGASYARQAYARNTTNWDVADGGTTPSKVDLVFPVATEDWGSITHYALCTAATAGEVFGFGQFTYEQLVMAGDQMTIPAGGMSINFVGPQTPMVL